MPDNFINLNNPDFYGILLRFVINTAFLIVLIGVVYFRYTKKEKFLFTFFLMGIIVFFITAMLSRYSLNSAWLLVYSEFCRAEVPDEEFQSERHVVYVCYNSVSVINSLKLVGSRFLE
jgi:hypothetical protein